MKKLRLLALSLMTVSFLTNCGGGSGGGGGGGGVEPGPYPETCTLTIHLENCMVENDTEYEMTYPRGATIDPVVVVPNEGYSLNKKSVPDYHYYPYWKEKELEPESNDGEKAYVFRDFVLMHDLEFGIRGIEHHTLKLNLTRCTINGQTTYSKTYNDGETIEPLTVVPDGDYILYNGSVPASYKPYWKESDTPYTYILSGLVMDQDHEININASQDDINQLTLTLNNCTVNGSSTYTRSYVWNTFIDPITVTPNKDYILNESSISEDYRMYWSKSTTDPGSYVISGLKIEFNKGSQYSATIDAGTPRTLKLTLNNCYVEDGGPTVCTYREGEVTNITIAPSGDFALGNSSITEGFQNYWQPSEDKPGCYVLLGLEMTQDYEIGISAVNGYTVTSELPGISIFPSVALENEPYVGQLKIENSEEERVFSESLDSAILDDGEETSIVDKCTCTLQASRKIMKIEIPANVINSNLKITASLIVQDGLWYRRSDWWNYCSNEVKDEQALEADIGMTVSTSGVSFRLIDVDRDDIANTDNKAHCTFDRLDCPNKTVWSDTGSNQNFVTSTLNTHLQPGGGGYNSMPAVLMNDGVIKTVTKHVKTYSDGEWVDTTYPTRLFPFSSDEISGDETTSYSYYINTDGARRKKGNIYYWLRSPDTRNDFSAESINYYDGSIMSSTVGFTSPWCAIAFCI